MEGTGVVQALVVVTVLPFKPSAGFAMLRQSFTAATFWCVGVGRALFSGLCQDPTWAATPLMPFLPLPLQVEGEVTNKAVTCEAKFELRRSSNTDPTLTSRQDRVEYHVLLLSIATFLKVRQLRDFTTLAGMRFVFAIE